MNADWLILPQYAKKLTCDEFFILMREKYVNLKTHLQAAHVHRYDTGEVENEV
jgi:hypothetical protein